MTSIAFIDTEIEPNSQRILDIGSVKDHGSSFHSNSVASFIAFLKGTKFICGHNIFNHDLKYIQNAINDAGISQSNIIDTLFLSPLLFPAKPYHALLKDDKLQTEDTNNPLNDSIKARDLFFDEVAAFHQKDEFLKQIFYLLLHDKKEFCSFFDFIAYKGNDSKPEPLIQEKFHSEVCNQTSLNEIIAQHPIELAYCLALINCRNRYSITPPWVLRNYPEVERIMFLLRNKPCVSGCVYCNQALDIHKGLKRYFGFDSFRTYAHQPLQENAVKAAVDNKSILAVFPTGGGKSITFQVPALMSGENTKGLTVVISPLQSLMKDQVDNLEKVGIIDAVTINGLLDPIERGKSFERVEDGSASILYISPESLRSKTIERLLLGRNIVRFVIDEAHCFSSWGQDFRVDYLYIGDFIKSLQEKKNREDAIPVSCFTATAKRKVIEDICSYFKEKLSIGGKSITFQVPALMSGENTKGLTVVISPLQSLMKDQVDNLEKVGIIDAVTINGLLDPIERGKSFERVEDGSASILYISPESLRSKTIERLLLGRNIVRFVIDEAHCFSSWGQDFRVDYLYIGDFIKSLQEKKNREDAIPVSCFTATAKRKVIEDICSYFKEKLS
ncbi:MAG: DEAD/DEAH box helicase, partial [Candidatus Brocadiaceae bacterium]